VEVKHVRREKVLELPDGSGVELTVVEFSGRESGPRVYVGGGVHGDEVGAVAIVQRLIQRLDSSQLRGTVVCVPVQNALAFQMHHRLALQHVGRSPMDQFPGDPWLTFPGDPSGNGGAVVAAQLFEWMTEADAVIDVHTPTTGGRYVPFIFVPPVRVGETSRESLRLARVFGPDFILDTTEGIYVSDGTPHVELARRGVPAFGFEIGEGGRVVDSETERGVEGVLNVLVELGMLEPVEAPAREPRVVSSMTALRAHRGGMLSWAVDLGAEVREGELLAQITDLAGDVVEEIVATHAGPLMRITTFGAVAATDRIAQIGVEVGR
jgi:predicted deacylase